MTTWFMSIYMEWEFRDVSRSYYKLRVVRFMTSSNHLINPVYLILIYNLNTCAGARWAESVPKRRIWGKEITHSLAPLASLRSIPRRTAALRSAGAAPLRSALLAALVH